MQEGALRADRESPWMPFLAMERFTVHPVAFRWVAWARRGSFVRVRISDRYENDQGGSSAKLFGLITIASQHGTREVNEASLARYLAESAWIPPMLRDPRFSWQELEPQKFRATLRDATTTASVDITFAETGEIRLVETQRYRDVRGTPVLTPWRGRYEDYEPMDGFVIPRSAYVEWVPPEGAVEVWRGRIVDARYRLH